MTEPNDLVLIHKAQSIIQREALMAALTDAGLEPVTSPRDMSRKVADDTVDLALDGYSVFFDGFPIFVKNRNKAAAEDLVTKFMAKIEAENQRVVPESISESPYLRRYFFCSLFSFMIPVVLHIFGAYHLIKGLRNGEKIQMFRFVFASALYLLTLSLPIVAIQAWLLD